MSTKCLLCTAVVGSGQKFYDHLEDIHMMPIRRQRIVAAGIDKYGKKVEMPGMGLDLEALPKIEFRDEQRRAQPTPGMTSAEFFKSKLPGFEDRYKESPFFRLEQERKEREQTAKRRPILRTGGRGRTVVTRGRA